jgi:dephospho-CoA kinase
MLVGLTGGIGSGKSVVLNEFKALGVPTCSADVFARIVLQQNPHILEAIINRFNGEYLNADQTLNRKKLREKVFDSAEDKEWLEKMLHPLIAEQIDLYVKQQSYPYCVIEIPLLIETNMDAEVDRVLSVDCPEEMQLERASQRDGCTVEEIKKIIASQITREKRRAHSDDVIDNISDIMYLRKRVRELHEFFLELATPKN